MTWQVVADVGGTNMRFAASDRPGQLSRLRSYSTGTTTDFSTALAAWLDGTELRKEFDDCSCIRIAAAGPVENGVVALTNASLLIDAAAVSHSLGGVRCEIVNDLMAVAMLLPFLDADDCQPLAGTDPTSAHGPRIAINIGTGFGASTCIPMSDGRWLAASSEAGHMALAAASAEELTLVEGAETLEGVLSGSGVLNLYERVASDCSAGATGPRASAGMPTDAEAIFRAVPHDAIAASVAQRMTQLLGRVVGDLVLASGAWGGAFLCGSVVRGWSSVADPRSFRAAFERKGAMTERMRGVPTAVIAHPNPALIGLSHAHRFSNGRPSD
jgi:glucokinase